MRGPQPTSRFIAHSKAVEAAGIAIEAVLGIPAPLKSLADQVIRSAECIIGTGKPRRRSRTGGKRPRLPLARRVRLREGGRHPPPSPHRCWCRQPSKNRFGSGPLRPGPRDDVETVASVKAGVPGWDPGPLHRPPATRTRGNSTNPSLIESLNTLQEAKPCVSNGSPPHFPNSQLIRRGDVRRVTTLPTFGSVGPSRLTPPDRLSIPRRSGRGA
jgi:hypothetical protein